MGRPTPLSEIEKIAIKTMVSDGYTIKEISTKTTRAESTIKKYIKENLAEEASEGNISDKLKAKLLKELIKNGVDETKAREGINIANNKLKSKLSEISDEEFQALYNACLQQQSARELFVTKTSGGNNGVAIMTPSASQRGEVKTKSNRDNLRDCIFNPKS